MRNVTSCLFASAIVAATATAASAADLSRKVADPALVPAAAQLFDWSGLKVGGQVGFGWGSESDDFTGVTGYPGRSTPPIDDYDVSGALGGVHIGYDRQFDALVLGAIADFNFSGLRGDISQTFDTGEGTGVSKLSLRNTWQSTFRVRAGYAFDRFLVYATGGVAIGDVKVSYRVVDPTATNYSGSQTKTRVGWTAGGGVEYAIDKNWSVGIEGRYVDLGKADYSIPAALSTSGTKTSFRAGFTETVALAVVNYRF